MNRDTHNAVLDSRDLGPSSRRVRRVVRKEDIGTQSEELLKQSSPKIAMSSNTFCEKL